MRKIFWNLKTSFFGMNFFKYVPTSFLFYPVLAGVPLYAFSVAHSGNFLLIYINIEKKMFKNNGKIHIN